MAFNPAFAKSMSVKVWMICEDFASAGFNSAEIRVESAAVKPWSFNRILRSALLLCILFFSLFRLCPAQQTTSLDARRIEIEEKLQLKVDNALQKMLDTKDFIAIVNVELGEEKIIFEKGVQKTIRLLPGVPEKREVGKKEDVPSEEALYKYFITNIFVTLTMDKGIPQEKVDDIKAMIITILDLNFKRGDTIAVNQTEMFIKTRPDEPQQVEVVLPWWRELLERKDIVWIIPIFLAIIILAIFLFGTLRRFFSQVVAFLPNLKTRTVEERHGGNVQAAGGPGSGPGGFGGSGESVVTFKTGADGKKFPFSFVNRANLNNLYLLIKDKTPEQIASVLHYLDPELSSILLSKLDPRIRAQILITIPRERQFSPEEVDSLDAEIKRNINYLIGGMDMLIGIYESADKDAQLQMMQMLQEHRPDVVEKIRARTVSFDDLLRLDKSSLRMVLREIPLRSLAISLKATSQELKGKVLEVLPEGMSEILKEEIDFSQAVSNNRIDEEQRKITQLVRKLSEEGRIIIKPGAGGEDSEEEPGKTEPRKVGAPYKQEASAGDKVEAPAAVKPPAAGKTPAAQPPSKATDTSSIARLLAERKLRMNKNK